MSNLQVEANQSTNNIPITLTPKQQPTLLLTPDKVWGTKDYEDLENKPSLNGRELTKGMTLADFNLYPDKVEKNEKYISELEATVDILTNTDTKKGELVHITDALPLPTFENKVDGAVEQETTRGVNLVYISSKDDYSYSSTLDGDVVIINGTSEKTGNVAMFLNDSEGITLKANETYTVSVYIDGTVTGGTYKVIYLQGITIGDYGSNKIVRKTITLTEDKKIRIISFDISANQVFTNMKVRVQIEKGNYGTDYEKYTGNQASPNSSYPQEIKTITGNVSVKSTGKNLFDRANAYVNFALNWETGANFGESGSVASLFIPTKAGDKFTINYSSQIMYYDKNKDYLGCLQSEGTTIAKKTGNTFKYFTTPNVEEICYMRLGVRKPVDSGEDKTDKDIMLNREYVLEPYEPYKEKIVPLDLKGNWVGAINDNIRDYLVTDKKKYWLVKNVGKVVLDGSEKYTDISIRTNTIRCLYKLTGGVSYTSITSHLIYRSSIYSSDIEGQLLENNYLVLSFPIDIVGNTLASLKTWLSTNNVTVYYQLVKPQIIELGELPEPIKTFEGVNDIQVLANLDTEIEVKYALDVKKYFENKIAEISAQII